MTVVGHLFADLATTHKLIGLVVQYDGLQDIRDTVGLQKSKTYEIRDAELNIVVRVDDDFMRAVNRGVRQTSYALLVVPNGVTEQDFTTMRAAMNLGVIVAWTGTGAP